jgi:hypothetical protein
MRQFTTDRIARGHDSSDRSSHIACGRDRAIRPLSRADVASVSAPSHSNGGMRRHAGGKFPMPVTAPRQLEPRPRTAHFFRKNAKKTSEAISRKGFTSNSDVPQKSILFRKNTPRIESKRFVRGAYVEVPRLRKIPESLGSWSAPSGMARSYRGNLDTDPSGFLTEAQDAKQHPDCRGC